MDGPIVVVEFFPDGPWEIFPFRAIDPARQHRFSAPPATRDVVVAEIPALP
ncbi:hypothetical protein [Methylobacterium sp. SyP6R]|uniref:hypothetical protein n=1 Tax=Methylobacterium sp. SyP6R TaxID=2718876 RepID=UPI001F2A1363|nr:hypothetical protein [Methylobacterium sp. SyP6R]MCF4130020.1 hypothetical protein [Methylobacterium sp. SyP6R]